MDPAHSYMDLSVPHELLTLNKQEAKLIADRTAKQHATGL